jgi:rhodanese-related sulfurtransferase
MAALPPAAWRWNKPFLPLYFSAKLMPDITSAELKARQQAGETPLIIDVREPWEFEESRISGSQNIPLGTLPTKLDDLEESKDEEVIVHCKSGARSSAAKAFLTQQGFANVRNLEGGIMAYQAG